MSLINVGEYRITGSQAETETGSLARWGEAALQKGMGEGARTPRICGKKLYFCGPSGEKDPLNWTKKFEGILSKEGFSHRGGCAKKERARDLKIKSGSPAKRKGGAALKGNWGAELNGNNSKAALNQGYKQH